MFNIPMDLMSLIKLPMLLYLPLLILIPISGSQASYTDAHAPFEYIYCSGAVGLPTALHLQCQQSAPEE